MKLTFLVKKGFQNGEDYIDAGSEIKMSEEDAADFVSKGLIELKPEETEETVSIADAVSSAISKAFAAFTPTAPNTPEAPVAKKGFGAFLSDIAQKNVNITTDGQGGYATTTYVDPSIDVDLLKPSGIAARATTITLNGTNNTYGFNVVSSIGNVPAITAEGATIAASQPVVTRYNLVLKKATYRYDVTGEALEDTGALVSEINIAVPAEFEKFIENGILNGVGTTLVAVVGHAQTVVISTASAASTISAIDIDNMYVAAKDPSESVWVMSRSAYAEVQGIESTLGQRLFVGPTGLGPAPFGTMKGLPILVSDYCQAVGTVGDILLMNLSKYRIAAKGGLRVASSAHIRFLEDEEVFRFIYRLAGTPVGLKLTATDSTVIGDFVDLATRS